MSTSSPTNTNKSSTNNRNNKTDNDSDHSDSSSKNKRKITRIKFKDNTNVDKDKSDKDKSDKDKGFHISGNGRFSSINKSILKEISEQDLMKNRQELLEQKKRGRKKETNTKGKKTNKKTIKKKNVTIEDGDEEDNDDDDDNDEDNLVKSKNKNKSNGKSKISEKDNDDDSYLNEDSPSDGDEYDQYDEINDEINNSYFTNETNETSGTNEDGSSDDSGLDTEDSDSDDDTESSKKQISSKRKSDRITGNEHPSIEELSEQMRKIELSDGRTISAPTIINRDYTELADTETMVTELARVYDKWCGEESRNLNDITLAYWIFGLEMNAYHTEEVIDKVYSKLLDELLSLNIALEHDGIMNAQISGNFVENLQKKFNMMYELLYTSRDFLINVKRIQNCRDPDRANSSPDKVDMFRFSPMIETKSLTSFEQLYLYIMRRCSEARYRKMKGDLYTERKIQGPDGKEYGTYSWQRVCTIKEFIISQCNPRTNWEMWRCMMDGNTFEKTAKYINEFDDPQLPILRRDRTVSAWRNGLWFADYAAFYPYTRKRIPHVCAAVYIDQEFDNTDYGDDYMNIPCVIKKILRDQGYNKEEQSFILGVGLGRLLFEPGKYDKWEIIPFLWGLAQTGKSCIIEAIAGLFSEEDIASVGNNFEKTFGLAPLIGKFIWIGNDVKYNFGMDPGELQMMTSLENMSVPKKYHDAISLRWNVPGIIAGNEIPRLWRDTLKSLERRILMIVFPNSVKRKNSVKLRLEKQRSLFYRLITYAYHDWQRRCGKKNVWDFAPQCFRENRRIIQEHGNPFEAFLNSNRVNITQRDEDYVPMDVFRKKYWAYCRFSGLKYRFEQSHVKNALATRGIKMEQGDKVWPIDGEATDSKKVDGVSPGSVQISEPTSRSCAFLVGIKLVEPKNLYRSKMSSHYA